MYLLLLDIGMTITEWIIVNSKSYKWLCLCVLDLRYMLFFIAGRAMF